MLYWFLLYYIMNQLCCCCSGTKSCLTLCDPMDWSTPGLSVPHYLLDFTQVHVHWTGDAVQASHPLLSSLSTFNLSHHQGLFQRVQWTLHIRWPKYWSFSFSISPSNEFSGLISLRTWFDLLAVQGTLKSLLQHHNQKASILQHSAFLYGPTHPYITTGKTIALTIWTLSAKWCLCFLICYLGFCCGLPSKK